MNLTLNGIYILFMLLIVNLFSVNITNPMPDSHYVYCIEAHLEEVGQPVLKILKNC